MEAFQNTLKRHGLPSIHAAHRRFKISREALTKMEDGDQPGLDVVERFARAAGEDVNHWRALYGYPPVETGAEVWIAGVEALVAEFGEEARRLSYLRHPRAGITVREATERLEEMRAMLETGRASGIKNS